MFSFFRKSHAITHPLQGMTPYLALMVLKSAMVKGIDHQTGGSAFLNFGISDF